MNKPIGYVVAFVVAFALACAPMVSEPDSDGGRDAAVAADGSQDVLAPDTSTADTPVADDTPATDTPIVPDDTAVSPDVGVDVGTADDAPVTDAPVDVPVVDTRACLMPLSGCSNPSQCCSGSCRAHAAAPGSDMYCCYEAGVHCVNRLDCCGSMSCSSTTHLCVCIPPAGFCSGDADCCSGVCTGQSASSSGMCS